MFYMHQLQKVVSSVMVYIFTTVVQGACRQDSAKRKIYWYHVVVRKIFEKILSCEVYKLRALAVECSDVTCQSLRVVAVTASKL